jgi:anti-sigma-K factor RskA
MDLHEPTAAYALDALDADEAETYERHLGQCEQCREQLAELNETAGALAFGAVAPTPPSQLRSAILEAAAAERTNVVPLFRRRWVARGLAVAAAAAACVVVGLVVSLSKSNNGGGSVSMALTRNPNGRATVLITGLEAAPQGKTYEAWVIPVKKAPRPAGLFSGGTVRLHLVVPNHATVAVTIERAGGVSAPTSTPIVSTPT